jgi:hypothetical protein
LVESDSRPAGRRNPTLLGLRLRDPRAERSGRARREQEKE